MIPLVDIHCHLLAGLDDGPRTEDDAVAMCRIAHAEGVRWVAATAHQNERWSAVTPDLIRAGVRSLRQRLSETGVSLNVLPNAEVMIRPELESLWETGALLSVADRGKYVLLEMPDNCFVDLLDLCVRLGRAGVRPILAHAERYPEVCHTPGVIEELIQAGCLIQVSSGSVTARAGTSLSRLLQRWFQRGLVHLLGSDGHSVRRRPPLMTDAYLQIRHWAGDAVADRVCSTNGLAVLQGMPVRVPNPAAGSESWLARFWSWSACLRAGP